MATRKNPKRLQCLKKKSKELKILCDVGVLFICKDINASFISCSFDSWPEDSKSCLELIDKYKKTISVKNGGSSSSSGSILGKRKERSDTQEDFLELAEKVKAGVKNLGHDELIQLLSRVDQAKMGVDQRLQFVKQECDSDGVDQRPQFVNHEFDLVFDNEGVGSFDGFDLFSGNYGLSFLDDFELGSGNIVTDGQTLQGSNQGPVRVDDLEGDAQQECQAQNSINSNNIEIPEISDTSDDEILEISDTFEEKKRQTFQASSQDHVLVREDHQEENQAENSIVSPVNIEILEISDTSEDEIVEFPVTSNDEDEDEEVELIPSRQSWLLFDFFDQLQ